MPNVITTLVKLKIEDEIFPLPPPLDIKNNSLFMA